MATKRDLTEFEANLLREIKNTELRLTTRLGGMIVAGVAVISALVAFVD